MSINKLSHLKDWEKIYLEVTRELSTSDDDSGLMFRATSSYSTFVDDDDTFYTLDDLKKLTNDGMPKQGEMIEILHSDWVYSTTLHEFVAFYKWCVVVVSPQYWITRYDWWRFPRKKVQLTLAEVEERLRLDAWSLIIK